MKKTTLALLATLAGSAALAQTTLVNWSFDEVPGSTLMQSTNTGTLTGTWEQSLTGVTQNGSGLLVTSGDTQVAASNKQGLGIAANSGVYDMIFSGVRFNNLTGNDYLLFGFRTTQTGSLVSSSRERANFKVGNFNGTAGLDMEASVNPDTVIRSSYDVAVNFNNAFDFVLRIDTDNNLASAWYDIGSGLTQLGSNFTLDTATTINTAALRLVVSDGGTGDSISIDNISVVAIPEPGTLALVGIVLGSLLLFRRKR